MNNTSTGNRDAGFSESPAKRETTVSAPSVMMSVQTPGVDELKIGVHSDSPLALATVNSISTIHPEINMNQVHSAQNIISNPALMMMLMEYNASVLGKRNSESAGLQNTEYPNGKRTEIKRMLETPIKKEDIAMRPGPRGVKLKYMEGWKLFNKANEIFGFDGWGCKILDLHMDFVEEYPLNSNRWNASCSAMVEVYVPGKIAHQDIGCGSVANCPSKGEAIQKVKKEAVTDARKRALKMFGPALGGSLYEKESISVAMPSSVGPAKPTKAPSQNITAAMSNISGSASRRTTMAAPPNVANQNCVRPVAPGLSPNGAGHRSSPGPQAADVGNRPFSVQSKPGMDSMNGAMATASPISARQVVAAQQAQPNSNINSNLSFANAPFSTHQVLITPAKPELGTTKPIISPEEWRLLEQDPDL